MKKFFILLFAVSLQLFYSCETTELELLQSPNALADDQADADLLLNSIQRAFVTNAITFNDRSADLTRVDYVGGRDYFAMFNSSTLDGVWSRSYSNIFSNTAAIEVLDEAEDASFPFHLGVSKTLQAYTLMQLVDFLGDVPLSEALNPLEFPNPNLDDDASVYSAARAMLDEASSFFNATGGTVPGTVTDFFYASDVDQWQKLVNTLKMRYALTTGDTAAFNAIANNPDSYISDSADDFQFDYGTQLLNPNTRHPDYNADYTTSGANIYHSNWLMETMQGVDKSDGSDDDPRIRYYWFRQAGCTPGASCDPDGDGQFLSCSLETPPPHYVADNISYCWLEDGYWGRDHGDDDGTPPDNFLRTAAGVYPAGGLFDDDKFRNGTIELDADSGLFEFVLNASDDGVNQDRGAVGAGIEPIILASFVDFWRAEVALSGGNPGAAAGFVRAGMEKSIAKAQSTVSDPEFSGGDLLDDTTFNTTTGEIITASLSGATVPSADYISNFVDDTVGLITDTSADSWNVLAEQYFIAMYGGAGDAYNFYRRTGFPTTVKPNLEPNPGVFPRTFLYPSVEVIANPNIIQRQDNATQVFWDTQPAGPAFPSAN